MSLKTDRPTGNYVMYTAVDTRKKLSYEEASSWKFWTKKRYIVAILGFLGFLNVYALRSNLSIAIVDMTTLKNITLANGTIIEKREFEWDSKSQGYVLSSFFYGYICTQILGGYLAAKFGGAKIFGIGIATTAIFTILTPWIASTNIYLLIALRTAEGFFEGVNYPAILAVWTYWAPPLEKARLISIGTSGGYFGTVVAMPLCSLIATYFGWQYIFYVFGGLALFWYVIWTMVVKDSPAEDSRISPQELKYITESINAAKSDEPLVVPWRSLLTCKHVWALNLILSCETWGLHTLTTFLPQMMKSALKFDLNKSGVLSALPYIAMAISVQVGGQIADWILKKNYMTITSIRKLNILVGFVSQAIFLLAAAIWISPVTTPIFVVLGATFGGIALSGIMVNPLDIAPQFASIIFGFNNTFAALPGIVSPILTGYLVTDMTNVNQWKVIFYITSGLYLTGAITSAIFISGELQPWAKIKKNENLNGINSETSNTKNKQEL